MGRDFGLVPIGFGFVELLLTSGAGGLWLVLIGGFLATVAGAEEEQAKVETALGDVRVDDVMTPDPTVAPADLSVAEFLDDYVFHSRYPSFPLAEDGGRAAGLVTLNRVKKVAPEDRQRVRVRDIACRGEDLVKVGRRDALPDVLQRLSSCSDGRALVVEGDRVVGIVSPSDISRKLQTIGLQSGDRDLPQSAPTA